MLWILLSVMALTALFAVVWPMYRSEQRVTGRAIGIVLCVALGSGFLYQQIGRPDAILAGPGTQVTGQGPDAGQEQAPDVAEMVTSLANRLEANPDDIDGWKMLGRSYGVLRQYPEAIQALERAVALENSSNGQTLVDLGEAIFMNDNQTMGGRAGELFEGAIKAAPDNPKAMFYSGLAAAERGDEMLAADRWETLLATAPPAEIEGVLRERIAMWRGVAPEPAAAPDSVASAPMALSIAVTLAAPAQSAVDPNATVYVIARDPAQPSPPIAAARRKANELPINITMTDADAMIPGRLLSGFQTLEIVARVSASGQPIAQAGDWYGSVEIDTANQRQLSILVDQQVP